MMVSTEFGLCAPQKLTNHITNISGDGVDMFIVVFGNGLCQMFLENGSALSTVRFEGQPPIRLEQGLVVELEPLLSQIDDANDIIIVGTVFGNGGVNRGDIGIFGPCFDTTFDVEFFGDDGTNLCQDTVIWLSF